MKTGKLDISARHVMHFIMTCKNLQEAQKAIPKLTAEQYHDLRSGMARLTGSTNTGLEYEAIK